MANFYFGDDGVMRTGKQVIYDERTDENQNWYFHTDGSRKGQGYHGIKDNVLYIYGLRQEADKDLRCARDLRRQAVPGKRQRRRAETQLLLQSPAPSPS